MEEEDESGEASTLNLQPSLFLHPFHPSLISLPSLSLLTRRFMRFMERYAEDNGLGFAKKE